MKRGLWLVSLIWGQAVSRSLALGGDPGDHKGLGYMQKKRGKRVFGLQVMISGVITRTHIGVIIYFSCHDLQCLGLGAQVLRVDWNWSTPASARKPPTAAGPRWSFCCHSHPRFQCLVGPVPCSDILCLSLQIHTSVLEVNRENPQGREEHVGSRRLHFKVLFLISLHCVEIFLCSQIELFCFAKHSTSFLPRSLSMLLHLPASPPFGEGWLLHLPTLFSLWRRLAAAFACNPSLWRRLAAASACIPLPLEKAGFYSPWLSGRSITSSGKPP